MTKTIPADLRKAAKTIAREQGIPHQTALDRLARQAGHSDWGALLASKRTELDPFRRLILDLWNAGGTDVHIEPWKGDASVEAVPNAFDDAEEPMTVQERHLLLSQLSTMMIAQVTPEAALKVLREHHGGRIATAAANLEAGIASGRDLAEVMFEDTANFPGETGMIVRTGSSGPGETAKALRRASDHQEKLQALAADTSGAMGGATRYGAKILFRIHGRRRLISTLDADAFDALRTAIVPGMTRWDDARPADGTVDMRIEGIDRSFPVASFPTEGSHKFVARIPDRRMESLSLEHLGIRDLDGWMDICRSGPGIVIVSGRTSSGKSTTIAKTIERLRSEGIDAVAEEDNAPFREGRIEEMVLGARTRTVLLESFGSSLDRAIANAMTMGLGNGHLSRLFRGGMHQELHPSPVGPRRLDTMIMPWG